MSHTFIVTPKWEIKSHAKKMSRKSRNHIIEVMEYTGTPDYVKRLKRQLNLDLTR